jgi:hypothetical protein
VIISGMAMVPFSLAEVEALARGLLPPRSDDGHWPRMLGLGAGHAHFTCRSQLAEFLPQWCFLSSGPVTAGF